MRISDWSSDVCSSDLGPAGVGDGCVHDRGGEISRRPRSGGRGRTCASTARRDRVYGRIRSRPPQPATVAVAGGFRRRSVLGQRTGAGRSCDDWALVAANRSWRSAMTSVLYEQSDRIVTLTLNRADTRKALLAEVIEGLVGGLERANPDKIGRA